MRHPANSWSVGLTSKVSLSSHSGLSKQFKFAGCLNPRFGDGKKRYFPGSISPKSKRPSCLSSVCPYAFAAIINIANTLFIPMFPRQQETSLPFPLFHHLHKILEQIMGIMRPRGSLWVILHREQRQIAVPHSFQGIVI